MDATRQESTSTAPPTFGEELRKEREIRGISLKEIADGTKISRRFLDAIERNDYATLPAPVFTRGFVREYARYLGLNADDMVNRYSHYVRANEQPEEPGSQIRFGTRATASRRNGYAATVIGSILLLALLAFWLRRNGQSGGASGTAGEEMPGTTSTVLPVLASTSTEQSDAGDSGLELRLRTTENSWITLDADGKTVLNEEVTAGTTREFRAEESFRFRTIGNAGGVHLTLNGTALPALGRSGQVVRDRVVDRAAAGGARSSSSP